MLNCPPVTTRNSIVDLVYPVGSYFITESSDFDTVAKVQNHFGGTWVQVTGTFLYGSTSATNSGTTSQAGEKTHTLKPTEMPAHTHKVLSNNYGNANANGFGNGNGVRGVSGVWTNGSETKKYYLKDNNDTGQQIIENTGGGKAHNNMPPYRTVYMYRRTA